VHLQPWYIVQGCTMRSV